MRGGLWSKILCAPSKAALANSICEDGVDVCAVECEDSVGRKN